MEIKTVKVATKNRQGFYICNADAVPKNAKIYKPDKKKQDDK